MYSTPILFLIFNRPDQTQEVFNIIKQIKPKYLYVAADGQRSDKTGDFEKCEITRKIVVDSIDWDCELITLFREENLGCGKAVSTAISWFFEHVEEGIILEDDCLPAISFFSYCSQLLTHYRDNRRIMHIGGCNFQKPKSEDSPDYYFSNYIHIWGWATWRWAWELYQYNIPDANDRYDAYHLRSRFRNKFERAFWQNSFAMIAEGRIDTWDIQWVYSIYKHGGLGITPETNLVSNIGFGSDATHTAEANDDLSRRPLGEIGMIKHPKSLKINVRADRYSYKKLFEHGNNSLNRMKFKIGSQFPWIKTLYLTAFRK